MREISFVSVKDAVRWSEEVSLLLNVGSTLGALISKPGSGLMSKQDMIDIAQTVTQITANCKPYKGMAMKAVYAGKDKSDDRDLGIIIASKLQLLDEGKQKDTRQLIALGTSTVKAMRSIELYDRRYSIKRMAKEVGVSRERFSRGKGWLVLRAESRQYLQTLMDQASVEIWMQLATRGWIS